MHAGVMVPGDSESGSQLIVVRGMHGGELRGVI